MRDLWLSEGQSWVQLAELGLAFVLSSLIGLERELRQKSAGLRTHTLVGVGAALFMLVSKYGFFDVLSDEVLLDPSRVAAQIVSGIGFIGGGLIFVRRDVVSGLTTAASIWLTAAIGMAAGGGLALLAVAATAAFFVAVPGYTALVRLLPRSRSALSGLWLSYRDGQGVLRSVMTECTRRGSPSTTCPPAARPASSRARSPFTCRFEDQATSTRSLRCSLMFPASCEWTPRTPTSRQHEARDGRPAKQLHDRVTSGFEALPGLGLPQEGERPEPRAPYPLGENPPSASREEGCGCPVGKGSSSTGPPAQPGGTTANASAIAAPHKAAGRSWPTGHADEPCHATATSLVSVECGLTSPSISPEGLRAWPRPAHFPSSGSSRVRAPASAAKGFPGRPTTHRPPGIRARVCGCPGRQATPRTSVSAPRRARTVCRWSDGPNDEAPHTATTSAAPVQRASVSRSGSSPTAWVPRWFPPAVAMRPGSIGPTASRTRPDPGRPRGTTSSPVTTTRTRGGSVTASVSWPAPAASPITAGLTCLPLGIRTVPFGHASPRRRMCRPGALTGPLTISPSRAAASYRSTVSARAGTGAPVATSRHSPSLSESAGGCAPARACPTTVQGPRPATA